MCLVLRLPGGGLCRCLRCFPAEYPEAASAVCTTVTTGTHETAAYLADTINSAHPSGFFAIPLCTIITEYLLSVDPVASALQETMQFSELRRVLAERTQKMLTTLNADAQAGIAQRALIRLKKVSFGR